MTSSGVFITNKRWTYFTPFSIVSTVYFEEVNFYLVTVVILRRFGVFIIDLQI